jgi:hypothetical protein
MNRDLKNLNPTFKQAVLEVDVNDMIRSEFLFESFVKKNCLECNLIYARVNKDTVHIFKNIFGRVGTRKEEEFQEYLKLAETVKL